jgi:hypothetical protein
MRIIFFN